MNKTTEDILAVTLFYWFAMFNGVLADRAESEGLKTVYWLAVPCFMAVVLLRRKK